MSAYDYQLGRREVETGVADTFEAEFPMVTGRPVEILSCGESPDRITRIDGIETGLELTAIQASSAEDMVFEMHRLARKKHETYERRGIFIDRPLILLGHLSWPALSTKERECLSMETCYEAMAKYPALYDVWEEVDQMVDTSDFSGFGFSEIWLMDDGFKYSSRRDPRSPADFFCFSPDGRVGFWERERKRRPYWNLILGR
jgi:hypothetical protein